MGANDINLIGVVYDKNPKNKLEEMASKGKIWKQKTYKDGTKEQPNFLNFALEDDTDFITVRAATYVFPKFQKLLMEDIGNGDIIMVRGKMGSGIRMFFLNEAICLTHLKNKIILGDKNFSESEKLFLK